MALTSSQTTELRQGARATASARGHRLTRFIAVPTLVQTWDAHCEICNASVRVIANPKPNEINIAGTAMAANCVWPNNVRPK